VRFSETQHRAPSLERPAPWGVQDSSQQGKQAASSPNNTITKESVSMKRQAFLASSAALAACSSNGGTTPYNSPPGSYGSVLANVTVVNTQTGALSPNMHVLLQNGTISQIVSAAGINPITLGEVVASGGYVVPGYNDYHAHPLTWVDVPSALNLMLSYGITGFRNMAGTDALLSARLQGPLTQPPQPELLELASNIFTPVSAPTAAAATAYVDNQLAAGADFIKTVGITGAPFQAALAEAKAKGSRLIGHLSTTDDVRATIAAGMKSIEHLGPRDSILIGCSTQEAAIRAAIPPLPPGGPGLSDPNFVNDQITLPTLFTNPVEFARYQQVINTYSTTQMQDLAGRMAAGGTWTVPTLIRLRTMLVTLDPTYANDPNLQYVPASTLATWKSLAGQFQQYIPASTQATLQQLYTMLVGLVQPFMAAGVQMMAGSDLGGEWVIPGVSLHEEFDMLGQAGLTPLQVLQMTTLNGAQFLGRTATMGTVAVGKNANLVVLSADPTQSVQNLHAITGVVRAGQYYSSQYLNTTKAAAAKRLAELTPAEGAWRCSCCSIYSA
jgi:imidazolonepropionase-like amidohydrolase